MELKALSLNENKTDSLFDAAESQQLLDIYADYYPKFGYQPPWIAYLILHEGRVVGSCSFTQAPVDGRVEIAYWTFEAYEGQGVASFACRELIAIAKMEDPTVIITAKTAPENNASTNILQKNGFVFAGIVQDDEIGDAWFWTLKTR